MIKLPNILQRQVISRQTIEFIDNIPEGFSDGLDDNTQLTEEEVETMISNGPLNCFND